MSTEDHGATARRCYVRPISRISAHGAWHSVRAPRRTSREGQSRSFWVRISHSEQNASSTRRSSIASKTSTAGVDANSAASAARVRCDPGSHWGCVRQHFRRTGGCRAMGCDLNDLAHPPKPAAGIGGSRGTWRADLSCRETDGPHSALFPRRAESHAARGKHHQAGCGDGQKAFAGGAGIWVLRAQPFSEA